MRWGVAVIVLFLIGGMILLYFVDTKQGGIDAANFHVAAEVKLAEVGSFSIWFWL